MKPKQQRFAEEYLIDSKATQAAIRAGYSAKTTAEQGYQLLHKTSVQEAVQGLQAEFREKMEVSRESVTQQLNTAYEQAKDNGQPAAMVQASMGIAKVHGLLVDKTEDGTKPATEMTPDELTDELASVRAELIAMMTPDELEAERSRVTAELDQIEAAQRDKAGNSLH